jgi:putative ABC transport system ATP-binding protein
MKRSQKLIELENVTKSYPLDDGVSYPAIRGITMSIDQGEFVSIMGPSGSGKSTLMHILGALDTVSTGKYLFKGKEIRNYSPDELAKIRNKEIGFVFQTFNLLPRTTVFKNVERPMLYGGVPKEERADRVVKALKLVGLAKKADNLSNKISGGEAQRVAIARALIMKPSIILADEPTGNLDSVTSKEIMDLLTQLHEQNTTIVLITHDPDTAAYAHRQVRVVDGQIVNDSRNK